MGISRKRIGARSNLHTARRIPRLCATSLIAGSLALGPASADDGSSIDYSRPEAWLALPGLPSTAAMVPKSSGFSDLQDHARADVFYVHPTTGMREDVQNVPIDDASAQRMGSTMLMTQATPFNAVARVFAPRYRQAALHVYDKSEDDLQAPMNFAYADVRRAFEHYIAHHNGGRPFFLVGHSQGSNHVQRLLSEAVQGTPRERLLVAAYMPGIPLPRSVFTDDLTRIPACVSLAQTGCAAVWGMFGEGHADFGDWEASNVYWDARQQRWRSPRGQALVNINPVSWDGADRQTPPARHRGAVPFGVPATHFTRPRTQWLAVRDDGHYAFVSPAPLPAELFNDGGLFGGLNYHVFDISLFWVDLRENARRRLNAYLRQAGVADPLIEAPAAALARVGKRFELRIDTLQKPALLSAEGLPEGLALDANSGTIGGMARRAGVYPVLLKAVNAAGSDHAELALTVEQGGD